jgi:hypothetical protein
MPWFFKSKPSSAAFVIGKYKLNDPVPTTGVREFSTAEYATMGRTFKDERNFNAPNVDFVGFFWKLQLGSVAGRIYKIAPYLLFTTKHEANQAAMATLQSCTQKLGKPSSAETGMFIWDTGDGNVILQTAETAEGLTVNLFLTSSAVKDFERCDVGPR